MSGLLHEPLTVDMQWIKSNFYKDLDGVLVWEDSGIKSENQNEMDV